MGKRYYIHQGDKTTADGTVVSGLPTVTWHGHAISYEGDAISCPACHSSGTIRCVGTRISNTGPTGKQQALSGDLCICGCSRPPRLIASQDTYWTDGDASATVELAGAIPETHDEQDLEYFFVAERDDGKPVNFVYRIDADSGKLHEGILEKSGRTMAFPLSSKGDATFWIPQS